MRCRESVHTYPLFSTVANLATFSNRALVPICERTLGLNCWLGLVLRCEFISLVKVKDAETSCCLFGLTRLLTSHRNHGQATHAVLTFANLTAIDTPLLIARPALSVIVAIFKFGHQ